MLPCRVKSGTDLSAAVGENRRRHAVGASGCHAIAWAGFRLRERLRWSFVPVAAWDERGALAVPGRLSLLEAEFGRPGDSSAADRGSIEVLTKEKASMPPATRVFGSDHEEIHDLAAWFTHAPPEKGEAQWRDGYSAKEQAKAWLRPGSPAVPLELWEALGPFAGEGSDEFFARPEHTTRLDRYSRARQHDLFGCVRCAGTTTLVVGVEAKACEGFDGVVADRASAAPRSKKRARCNLLARALFGRDVIDELSGDILDNPLGQHGYQLWTAAVGTIIEAQARKQDRAVLVVHQFAPRDLATAKATGDGRDWSSALAANASALDTFVTDLQAAGAKSNETEFVRAGTTLQVVKVESAIE